MNQIMKQINDAIKQYIEIYEPDDLTSTAVIVGHDCPAKLVGELIDIIVKTFFSHKGSYIKAVVITML